MAEALGQNGLLQVVPPAQLDAHLQNEANAKAAAEDAAAAANAPDPGQLASFIKGQFEIFRNHRNSAPGWSERMLAAMRTFNGQYDAAKTAEIKRYGGSEVYARLIAQKCRAASSLLRDIYLGPDRPWALRPPADPDVPPEIEQKIQLVIDGERQMVAQTGQPVTEMDLEARKTALLDGARTAAKKKAAKKAKLAEDKIEEMLRNGGFYHALAEFLVDLPIFPFACIKGPTVRVVPQVIWAKNGGPPEVKQVPTLTWGRVSPFDIWFTPGVSDIENANIIEKLNITRAEINDLLDLPGYNHEEVRAVLDEYGRGGLYDNWDTTDAERSALESRENPAWNRSGMICMMEFNGNVQGRMLQEYGLAVDDELRDYHVNCWVIGTHVIKAQLSPSPRKRHPYFITSFEKVPGTPVGNGLTDLLADIQEVTNATLRSLVNNISIASGPQVVVNDDRLSSEENGEDLYPWKRWHVRNDPVGNNSQQPISFFMPTSNVQPMIAVYKQFSEIADDVSAIPKYVGGQAGSGAGRTASGLAMLMGNASKILQTVSANVDRDVFEGVMTNLYDLIMLTDVSGLLSGDERVTVQGVNVAIQRETQRQRQLEFLQTTNNPTDMKIVGIKGRANVLRSVASTIGLDGDKTVPSEDELDKMEQEQAAAAKTAPIEERVMKGVQTGVESGVKEITAQLTTGALAMRAHLPDDEMAEGEAPPVTNNPSMDLAQDAAHAQGNQPSKITTDNMGPTTSLTGNMRGPNAVPISGGVG